MVYEPEEDSYLLLECLPKKLKNKKILEIGCGSGILSVHCAKLGGTVTSVDIDPEAVAATKRLARESKVKVQAIISNMFERVEGEFELIICNPPYLPTESKDPDIALDGGKEGWEFIEIFLGKAGEYLANPGKAYLLFSSQSKPQKVLSLIKKHNFCEKLLAKKNVGFFEELYVYELIHA